MDRLTLNPTLSWPARFLSLFLSGIMLATPFSAVAQLPTNPDVVHGQVGFDQQGANLFLNQSTQSAIVNFESFSIGAPNGVYITQPGSASALLSRVVGTDPSVIHGLLQATGIVYLVNQNGIYFGTDSRIDAGAFVASTLDITNADFLAGRNIFAGGSTAEIDNAGLITAHDFVVLLANNVRNQGDILAKGITMAGAERVTLQNVYGGKLRVDVTGVMGGVDNSGYIEADSALLAAADISQSGIINAGDGGYVDVIGSLSVTVEADAVISAPGGSIVARATQGDTLVSGAIDVSSDDGQGGTAHVLGQRVGLLDSATIDASGATGGGAVNVGGNFQGNGDLQNAVRTFVGSNVIIDVDAVDSGDGGTAIVWADGSTEFTGTITGRGAGFAEVSGKETLAFNGHVDLRGHNGELGTLLLDPEDILVTAGGDADLQGDFKNNGNTQQWEGLLNGTGGDEHTDDTFFDANEVSAAAITGVLGAAVELLAASSIKVEEDIITAKTGTLTLTAGTFIDIDNQIAINGALNLNATGAITVDAAIDLSGGSGAFTSTGTTFDSGGAGTLTTSTGDININNTGAITIAGDITTTTGAIDIDNGASINVDGNVQSSGDDIDLTASANVTIDNGTVSTTGAGTINIVSTVADVLIGTAADTTVQTEDGSLTVDGDSVTIGASGIAAVVTTTGTGSLDIAAASDLLISSIAVSIADDTTIEAVGGVTFMSDTTIAIGDNVIFDVGGTLLTEHGTITLDSIAGNVDIGTNSVLNAHGGDVVITATAGTLAIGEGTDIVATRDVAFDIDGEISVAGSLSPGRFLDIQTGDGAAVEGKFTLETTGSIDVSNDLVIGDADATNSNIELISIGAAELDLAGTVTAAGDIDIDLDGLAMAVVTMSGTLNATDDVTVTTQAHQNITGDGNITGDDITITALGTGAIDIGDIAAAGFAFLSAVDGAITTGSVTANANEAVSGFAIEVKTTTGDVTANGAYTADSQPSLNISIDPSNVINNARFTATGNIDIFATDTITVNADMHASTGRIVLRADDDGTGGLPAFGANDGTGDLVMSVGTTLTAPNGTIDVSGDNVTLGGVTSGGALTVINDLDGSDDDTITLTGDLRGDGGVTITAAETGDAKLDIDLQGDISITAINTAISITTTNADHDIDGAFALNINAGIGNITLPAIGDNTAVESLTVANSGAGIITLFGDITSEQDIAFTTDGGTVLGDGVNVIASITATSTDGSATFQGDVTSADAGGAGTGFIVTAESIIVNNINTSVAAGDAGVITLTATSGDIAAGALTATAAAAGKNGAVVTLDAADDLTVTEIATNSTALGGNISLTAGDNISLSGNLTATGGTAAGGAVTLNATSTTIAATTIDSTGTGDGPVSITGTVEGSGGTLAIVANSANVTLAGAIGGNDALALVDITTTGAAKLSLGGSITADDIELAAVTSKVVLTGDVTLTSTNNDVELQNADAAVGIAATTAGVQGLAISTGTGAVSLPVVGTTALDFLTVTTTTGATTLAGNITTVNAIDMSAAAGGININGDVTVDSTAGSIDLSGSNIEPNADTDNLIIGSAGTTTVRVANIGVATPVASLTINSTAGATLTGNITTVDDVTVSGDTIVGADIVGADIVIRTALAAGNDITLATINDDAAAARRILRLNAGAGAVTITEVGGTRSLGTLDITAAATSFGGDITADNLDVADITGAVTLAANVDIAVDNSAVDFGNAASIDGAFEFGILAGTGAVTLPTVGATLTDVNISGGTVTTDAITTAGGNVALTSTTGDITALAITTADAIGGDITLDSAGGIITTVITATGAAGDGGNIILHAVNDISTTDADINTSAAGGAGGAIGVISEFGGVDLENVITTGDGANAGGELIVNALNGTLTIASATTTGGVTGAGANQTYTATAIELGADAAAPDFDASGTAAGGNITVSATNIRLDNDDTLILSIVTTDGDINLSGAVNGLVAGDQDLTLSADAGTISVDSIGQATALGGFTVSTGTGTTNLDGSISVEGAGNDIDIDRAGIVLHRNVTLSALDGDVSINDLAAGGNSLTITADVNETNSGAVNIDAISDVSDLTATAGKALTTSDTIAGSGDISLTANADNDADDEDLTVGGSIRGSSVTLTAIGTTVDTGIILNADINNTAGSVTLSAFDGVATIDLNDDLSALGNITVDAGRLNLDAGAVTITSTEGNITTAEIDGSEDLTVRATQGNVTFGGVLGNAVLLGNLDVNAQSANINNIATNTGDINFSDTLAVVLESDVLLDTAGAAASGDVLFGNATIDSDAAGSIRNLTIRVESAAVAGAVSIGAVGGNVAVGTLTILHEGGAANDGTITLAGDITTDGTVNFDGASDTKISLADNIVITTTNDAVDLGGDADTDLLDGAFSLAVLAGTGQVDLPLIGSITAPTGLTTTSGVINILQDVTVAGPISMTATGAADIDGEIETTGASGDVGIATIGVFDISIDGNLTASGGIDIASGKAINIGTAGTKTVLTAQNDLTLAAAGDILLRTADSDLNSDGGHLVLRGGTDGTGTVDAEAGTTLSSFLDLTIAGEGAGAMSISGLTSNGSVGISQDDDISIVGTGISAVNDISVVSAAAVKVDGNVDSSGGEIFLESDSDNDGVGDLDLTLTTGALTAGTVTLTSNAGEVDIDNDPNNTAGGITFGPSAGITLGADLTANGPIDASVVTNGITLDAASTIDSTNADITLGAAIDGGQDLILDAGAAGVISLQAVTDSTSVTVTDAAGLVLNGNILSTVGAVDLDAADSTTLTDDVEITGVGVALGAVSGPHTLTLDGTAGAVAVDSGDIGSLSVSNATTVDFDEPFSTTGSVTVSAAITDTVTVGAVLAAGGDLNLTSAGDVTVSAAVSAAGATTLDSTAGTLDIDANVGGGSIDLAGDANITLDDVHIHATSGDITVSDSLDLNSGAAAGATLTSDAGDITFANAVDANAAGTESITVNALGGTVDFQAAVGATALGGITINAMASGFGSTVTTDDTTGTGDILVQGTGNTHTIAGNVNTGGGDWIIQDDVVVAADSTVDTDGGDLRVTGVINDNGNRALGLDADTGDLTLESSVGTIDALGSLTLISTGDTEINGEIRTVTAITLTGATNIELGSDVSLVASDAAGDILLDGGAIDGAFDLTATAGDDITIDGVGATTPLQRLRLVTTGATGNINIADNIIAVGSAEFITTDGTAIGVGGAVVAADAIFKAGTNVNFTAAQNNTAGNITATAGTLIDVDQAITAAGDVTFNITLASDLGAELTAGNDLSLLGGSNTLSGAARTLTATNGDIRVTGDFEGAQNLVLTAVKGDIYTFDMPDDAADPTSLTATSQRWLIEGDVVVDGAIDASAVPEVHVTAAAGDVEINGVGINFSNGGNNLLHGIGNEVTLDSTGGVLALDNVDVDELTIDAAASITLRGDISVEEDIDVPAAVTLGQDVKITTTDDDVDFAAGATVNGAGLEIQAGLGNVEFGVAATVGGADPLDFLTISAGDIEHAGAITTDDDGHIHLRALGGYTMNGTITAGENGNITIISEGVGQDLDIDNQITSDPSGEGIITLVSDGDVNISATVAAEGDDSQIIVTAERDINITAGGVTAGAAGDVIFTAERDIRGDSAFAIEVTADSFRIEHVRNLGNATLAAGDPDVIGSMFTASSNDLTVKEATGNIVLGNVGELTVNEINTVGNVFLFTDFSELRVHSVTAGGDVELVTTGVVSGRSPGTSVTGDNLIIEDASEIQGAGAGAFTTNVATLELIDVGIDVAKVPDTGQLLSLSNDGDLLIKAASVNITGRLDITAQGDLTVDGSVVTSAADFGINNAIELISGGDMIFNSSTSATGVGATITLDAGGAIVDTGDAGTSQISAVNLEVIDATSIGASTGDDALDIDVTNLTVAGVSGDSYIEEADGLTITSTVTDGGISITSAIGDVILTSMTTSDDSISVTATTGTLTVATVAAGTGNVTLEATAGSILDGADGTPIIGGLVTLTAQDGIGTTGDIETSADQLDVSVTGTGIIVIDETDGVELLAIDTVDGSITIETSGDTVATDVTSTDDDDADPIAITVTVGDLEVGTINAGTANGDVTLDVDTAAGQNVTDGDGNSMITADEITINATAAIGSTDNAINTDAAEYLDIDSTEGDIVLHDIASVTATDVEATLGDITLSAITDMTLGLVTATDGDATVTTGRNIIGQGGGSDDVFAETITLIAEGSIGQAAGSAIGVDASEAVNADADEDVIFLNADNAVTGLPLGTIDGTAITLDAAGKAITDANNAAMNVVGNSLTVVSAAGTGTVADAIETGVGTLTVTANTAGVVNIQNTGALDIAGIDNDGTDATVVNMLGSISTSGPVSSTDNVTLRATDSGTDADNLTIGDTVTSDNEDTITLQAGHDVTINAVVSSATGTVIAEADFDNSNDGTLSDGAGSIDTTNLLATGFDVTLDNADTTLTTLAGSAQGDYTFDTPASYDIGTVNAVSGVTTGSGNIDLDTDGTITVGEVVESLTGSVDITANGAGATVNVGNNVSGDDVTITGATLNVTAATENAIGGTTLDAATGTLNIDFNVTAHESLLLQADTNILLAANLQADDSITVNDGLEVDGNSTITADDGDVSFVSTVNAAAGFSLDVNAGDTVTFGGNVTVVNDLTVNAATLHTDTNIITVVNDLLLGGTNAVEIDGEASVFTADDIVFNANGTLDAAAGTETLQLVATAGNVVLGTIGNSVPLAGLNVDAAGIGIINNNITVAGAIDFADSANVDLSGDSSITSTAAGAVTFGTDVDGPFALQITNQFGAVTVESVGANDRLDSLSLTSQTLTVTVNGASNTTGPIDIDALDTATIGGAMDSVAGDIDVTGSAVTTAGTITTAGDINIDAFTTDVTIGAVVTSTGSDVEINAEVNVGLGANVIGDNVTAQANTGDVNVTFELDNTRGGYDFTGGDQVVVTENITAADGIRLQGLSGGADALSLEDTITAGTDITLTGGVTQSGALIVASTNGSVTIANDVATGANTLNIDALLGNAALGNITGTSIALDVDASTATLNGGTITTNGTIDFTGTGLTTLAAGTVTVTSGGGNIDFGDVGGVNQLTVDAGAGNLTFDGGDIANLTVTTAAAVNFDEDFNTDGQINVTSTAAITVAAGSNVTAEDALAFIGGSVDIDGSVTGHSIAVTGTTTLAGTINGNDGDVTMNSSVAVDGNSNVSSDNGNVTFLGVVEGPSTLTADAPTGTVTFTTTVGTAVTPLSGLDVNADVLVLNANVTTTGTVDLTGTDTVTLGADLVIDTTAADILFDNNSTINEVAGADARLTLTTLGDIRINDAFINDLLVTSGNNISLSGTIDTDADIGMAGALSVTLTDSVTLISAGNVDTPAVDGAQQLSIVSGGDVTTGALGGTTALESFNATGDNVETGAITANIDVNVIGTDDAAGAITTSGAVTSNNGAIELTAQGGALSTIVLGGNITADDDASFNGNVTLAAGANTFTAGDAVDFTGNLTGADEDVDINAAELTISGSGVLTVDSLDTIGVGLTELATDVTIIADGEDAGVDAINLGPVDGSHTLTLTATNGTGLISVSGGDIAGLSVTDAFNITFTGDLGTTGDVSVSDVAGTITVNAGAEITALGALALDGTVGGADDPVDITINGSLSGDSITLDTQGNAITLNGNVNGDDGLVDVQDAVTLTGPSIISSDNGNVQLQGDVTGDFALTLASGELVDLDADLATDSVTINGNAHLGGGRTITVDTALDVDGDLSANGTVTLNATDAGSTISLQSVGVNERPTSLDIDTDTGADTGVLQLEGDVHVAGDVLLDGADATTIVGHVTIDTTAGADGTSIDIDAISGTGNLTIAGGDADVDFQDAITALSSLTVVSSDTVQVDSTLNIPGAVGFDASELIDIDGAIGGTTAPASITVDGTTELGADVTTDGAITFQDSVELTDGDRTLTSNAGDVSFAGAVTSFAGSSHGLAVSAQSGNIAVQDLGQGADALGAVDLDADTADFNGTDIDSASIDTADVGLTTLNVDVSIDTTGLITLGDLIGVHLLTLTSVGEDVELQDAAIQALTIDGAVNVDFAGNFDTTGNAALTGVTGVTTVQITGSVDAGGTIAMTTAGNITIDGTVEADDDIDLTNEAGDTIDINAAITGAAVDVTSGTVELSNAVAANAGDVTITGNLGAENIITIDGDSLVAAENGNILFNGTVAGANSLEANAPGGTVDFNSTVGAGTPLGGLDVHADDVKLDNSVEVAGNIDVDADTIELADDAGDITTTAGSGGNLDLGTAAIDAENANVPDINLTSAGTLTVGPIGQTTQVESVDIHVNTVTDRITLGGSIDSDNAVDITGTAGVATNIHLGSDVDITAGDANITLGNIADANAHNLGAHGGTGDVQIGTIANGADVDIDGADITLGDSVAASVDIDGTNITINAITATDGISAVASNDGAIVSNGVLASSGSSIELIAEGAIDVQGNVTNSSGEVVISGNTDADVDDEDVTISANLDAGGDVVVTVQGAAGNINIRADQDNRGSTTLTGPVSLNEDLAAADDITVNGAIVIDGDNVPADPVRLITAGGSLDINGDITVTDGGVVENLTLTGTEEVVVENIGVGSPAGALEISTDQAGLGGNIEAASVDTTGAGMTTLHTGVDIDVTGAAGINLGHINGAESLTLSADAAGDVTLRNTDIASLTVDDADAVNVLGQLVASGDVTIAGTTDGIITVDDTADTLNGSISAGGNVTLGTAALIAVNGTVTAVEALTVSTTANVDIDDNLTGDSVDINGDGGISLAGDVRGTNQDVIFRDALTVDGNSTATSENGDLTFVSTIVGPFALNAFADSGTVNFEDSVGAIALASLVVTANAANIAGNISATAGVSFAGTEQVNLDAANVVITAGGAIFFATDSIVSSDNDGDNAGEFSLTLIAGADITINDAVVDGFDASDAGADTINLFGTISAQDPITLGANTVFLGDDAALHNDEGGGGGITATGSIDGEHEFTLSSGGAISLGAIGATEQPTELRIDNSNNTILAADTSVDGNIAILATAAGDADAIDVGGAMTSDNGSINLNAGGAGSGIELNGIVSANDDVTLNGADIVLTAVDAANPDINSNTGNIGLHGNFTAAGLDVDLTADSASLNGDVTVGSLDTTGVGTTTLLAAVAINASTNGVDLGELDGPHTLTITAASAAGAVNLDGVDIQALTVDDAVGVTLNGIVHLPGDLSISGAIDGIVDINADVAADGDVTIGDATTDLVDVDANIHGGGDITINATDVGGDISISELVSSDNGSVDINADDAIIFDNNGNVIGSDVPAGAAGVTVDSADITVNADLHNDEGSLDLHATGTLDINQSIETGPEGALDLDGDTALTLARGADLTAGGDITVNDNLLLDNPIGDSTVTSEDGDITLQNVAAAEIRNLTVTAAEGTVTIGSLGSADGDDTNDANNLTITAADVLLDNTANGRIEGNLTITATGDVDNNDNSGGGTELNVDGAATIAGNNVDLDGGLVVTGSVTVTALQDIGIGVRTVAQGNVTSGGDIILTADLDLDGDGGVEMNSADLVSTAGNITITGQGVVVDDVDATAGTITIDGLDGGIAAQTPGDVVADLAAITLDLDGTGPINVETDASNVNAATDGVAGSIIINNVGAGPIVFAGTTAGEDADITLAHTGAGLLTVNDTKASSGDVAIAGGGAIRVNRIDAEDGGATNGITDDAQTVRVTSTGAGDITIAEGDDDADPTNGRTGGISADFALTVLNADGDIDLNSESIFSAGSVELDSTTGSISDISGGDRVNIRALGSATLIGDDEVGNLTDILEVTVGELLVSANSGDADSGFATGLGGLADGSIGPRYVNFIGDAPGLLVWNGDVIGGPPAELQLWLRAGNFDSQGVMLDNTSQVFRNPFFYHKAVMLSDYRAPTTVLEYISASGGKIFGLPRHLALSNNIDILQYTDDPYSWDLEIRRRRDKSRRD